MLQTKANDEKVSDTQRRIIASARAGDHIGAGYQYLGRDRDGFDHVANTAARRVYRIAAAAGRVDFAGSLDELPHGETDVPSLNDYLHGVADGVGWDSRRVLFSEEIWGGFRQ